MLWLLVQLLGASPSGHFEFMKAHPVKSLISRYKGDDNAREDDESSSDASRRAASSRNHSWNLDRVVAWYQQLLACGAVVKFKLASHGEEFGCHPVHSAYVDSDDEDESSRLCLNLTPTRKIN